MWLAPKLFRRKRESEPRAQVVTAPAQTVPAPPDVRPASRLQIGELTDHKIGPGIGAVARLISVRNADTSAARPCRNVRAQLTFRHDRSAEAISLPGWFAALENGAPLERPSEAVPVLDSSGIAAPNQIWLILYVRDASGSEFHRFTGPTAGDTPVSDWVVPLDAASHLEYGEWAVNVEITCDGQDKTTREVRIECL